MFHGALDCAQKKWPRLCSPMGAARTGRQVFFLHVASSPARTTTGASVSKRPRGFNRRSMRAAACRRDMAIRLGCKRQATEEASGQTPIRPFVAAPSNLARPLADLLDCSRACFFFECFFSSFQCLFLIALFSFSRSNFSTFNVQLSSLRHHVSSASPVRFLVPYAPS
jgi:hypothetical protein